MSKAVRASLVFFVLIFAYSVFCKWLLVGPAFTFSDFVIAGIITTIGAFAYYVIMRQRYRDSDK